ncbi:hypothetical protein D3C72_1344590 [compost metagenome]
MGVDQRIAGAERFEFIRRGHKRLPGDRGQLFRHAHGIFRMGVQPRPHRRTAQRQLREVRQAMVDMLEVVLQHRHPAGDLLPEGQRRGVLQMGTTNFDDVSERLRFCRQGLGQHFQLRNEMLAQADDCRHVHRGREYIVRTLAFIDVIVRVYFALHPAYAAQQFARAVRQHLVHVHVALGAGAGLPDGKGEFVRVFIGQHFVGGADDSGGFFGGQQTQILVDLRGCAFGERQGVDQRDGHFLRRDAEMFQRALSLRAP